MRDILNVSHTKRKREKNRRVFLLVGWTGLILILCVTGLVFFMRSEFMLIRNISYPSLDYADSEELKIGVDKILDGYYGWFLSPRRNTLLYPKNEISDFVQSIPSVIDVVVKRVGLSGISIVARERTPAYLWCGETSESASVCAFADDNGFVFRKAPVITGQLYIKLSGHEDDWRESGFWYAGNDFRTLRNLKDFFGLHIPVVEIAYTGNSDYTFILKGGLEIYVDVSKPEDKTVSRVETFFATPPVALENLEYIDARFGNRIFYKSKTGTQKSVDKIE